MRLILVYGVAETNRALRHNEVAKATWTRTVNSGAHRAIRCLLDPRQNLPCKRIRVVDDRVGKKASDRTTGNKNVVLGT